MKIRKGTYTIAMPCSLTYEEEGSYGHDFPFMIHRKKGRKKWNVTHFLTGFNVTGRRHSLKEAKEIAKKLKEFNIFLMPTIETWKKAKSNLQNQNPEQYRKMIKIIYPEDK